MSGDKGKVPEHVQKPTSITPEALRVLLDAIQVLTLVQSPAPSAPANSGSESAVGSSNVASTTMSAPSTSSANSSANYGGDMSAGLNVAPTHTGFHCSTCRAYNIEQH